MDADSTDGHIPSPRRTSIPISERRLLLVVGDLAAVNVAVILAFNLRTTQVRNEGFALPRLGMVVFSALWIVAAQLADVYDLRLASSIRSSLRTVGLAVGIVTLGLLAAFLIAPYRITRPTILIWIPTAYVLIMAGRALYVRVLGRSFHAGRIALVMTSEGMASVWPEVQPQIRDLYTIAGVINPLLGDAPARLDDVINRREADTIVLGVRDEVPRPLFASIVRAHENGIRVRSLADLYEEMTGRLLLDQLGHSWLLSLPMRSQASHIYATIKRALDIVVAGIVLVVGAPFVVIGGLAMKATSNGDIFFRQTRVGRYGHPFTVLKLRTMRDADSDTSWTEKDDARITAVGRALRALHIDELPQAWAILRGQMSIVGPRPEQEHYVRQLEKEIDYYGTRHTVRPGLTGWAQVNYGYAASVEQARTKLSYDLYYIKRQSITLDLLILGRTLLIVLSLGGR